MPTGTNQTFRRSARLVSQSATVATAARSSSTATARASPHASTSQPRSPPKKRKRTAIRSAAQEPVPLAQAEPSRSESSRSSRYAKRQRLDDTEQAVVSVRTTRKRTRVLVEEVPADPQPSTSTLPPRPAKRRKENSANDSSDVTPVRAPKRALRLTSNVEVPSSPASPSQDEPDVKPLTRRNSLPVSSGSSSSSTASISSTSHTENTAITVPPESPSSIATSPTKSKLPSLPRKTSGALIPTPAKAISGITSVVVSIAKRGKSRSLLPSTAVKDPDSEMRVEQVETDEQGSSSAPIAVEPEEAPTDEPASSPLSEPASPQSLEDDVACQLEDVPEVGKPSLTQEMVAKTTSHEPRTIKEPAAPLSSTPSVEEADFGRDAAPSPSPTLFASSSEHPTPKTPTTPLYLEPEEQADQASSPLQYVSTVPLAEFAMQPFDQSQLMAQDTNGYNTYDDPPLQFIHEYPRACRQIPDWQVETSSPLALYVHNASDGPFSPSPSPSGESSQSSSGETTYSPDGNDPWSGQGIMQMDRSQGHFDEQSDDGTYNGSSTFASGGDYRSPDFANSQFAGENSYRSEHEVASALDVELARMLQGSDSAQIQTNYGSDYAASSDEYDGMQAGGVADTATGEYRLPAANYEYSGLEGYGTGPPPMTPTTFAAPLFSDTQPQNNFVGVSLTQRHIHPTTRRIELNLLPENGPGTIIMDVPLPPSPLLRVTSPAWPRHHADPQPVALKQKQKMKGKGSRKRTPSAAALILSRQRLALKKKQRKLSGRSTRSRVDLPMWREATKWRVALLNEEYGGATRRGEQTILAPQIRTRIEEEAKRFHPRDGGMNMDAGASFSVPPVVRDDYSYDNTYTESHLNASAGTSSSEWSDASGKHMVQFSFTPGESYFSPVCEGGPPQETLEQGEGDIAFDEDDDDDFAGFDDLARSEQQQLTSAYTFQNPIPLVSVLPVVNPTIITVPCKPLAENLNVPFDKCAGVEEDEVYFDQIEMSYDALYQNERLVHGKEARALLKAQYEAVSAHTAMQRRDRRYWRRGERETWHYGLFESAERTLRWRIYQPSGSRLKMNDVLTGSVDVLELAKTSKMNPRKKTRLYSNQYMGGTPPNPMRSLLWMVTPEWKKISDPSTPMRYPRTYPSWNIPPLIPAAVETEQAEQPIHPPAAPFLGLVSSSDLDRALG